MRTFRIAFGTYGDSDRETLSGRSGYYADGRWHSKGRYLDYTAESRSLATLERLVHYKRFDHLAPHFIYAIDIPNEHIDSVLALPQGWDGPDILPDAQALGDAWCDQEKSCAFRVPSAVTPGEFNIMVNTRHPSWNWKWVGPRADFKFDYRIADLIKRG